MRRSINVLLVDPHAAFRQALARILLRENDVSSVLEASCLAEARAYCQPLDVCVTELDLPDGSGIELIAELLVMQRRAGVIVLTASHNEALLARVVQAGAQGLLSKQASLDELLDAVRRVGRGEWLLDPMRTAELARLGRAVDQSEREIRARVERLTPRERQVLAALGEGLSDKEVADSLNISVDTVRTHLVNIFAKLEVDSRLKAALFAVRHGVGPTPVAESPRVPSGQFR